MKLSRNASGELVALKPIPAVWIEYETTDVIGTTIKGALAQAMAEDADVLVLVVHISPDPQVVTDAAA